MSDAISGAPILNAAVHRMCAWYVPAYAVAQCCFKSFALRSCQCGRKTRYGLEFWSLDLPSARVPALLVSIVPVYVILRSRPLLPSAAGPARPLAVLGM